MSKEIILKKIQNNFFDNSIEYSLDELTKELINFYPIFGELNVDIIEEELSDYSNVRKIIKYIDKNYVNAAVNAETGKLEELKEPINMSITIMKIGIDSDGTVLTITNETSGFTTVANKELTLFVSSLIGKKLRLQ